MLLQFTASCTDASCDAWPVKVKQSDKTFGGLNKEVIFHIFVHI
jgi:hypothetical protein